MRTPSGSVLRSRAGIGPESLQLARRMQMLGAAFVFLTIALAFPVAMNWGWGPGLMLGVLAAVFWLLVAATVRIAWFRARAYWAWKSEHGRVPDGARRLALVGGRIRCSAEPVVAPLSGRAAIAWEYQVRGPCPGEPGGTFEWSGSAQADCVLETASGPVPIRAGLLLEGVPWERMLLRKVGDRLDALLADTRFVSIDGFGGAGRLFSTIDQALADGDGFRWDVRRGIARGRARNRAAKERILEEGQEVTCIAPYRPGEGLLPLLEFFAASPEEVARSFRVEVAIVAGATACFGITQLLYFWAIFSR